MFQKETSFYEYKSLKWNIIAQRMEEMANNVEQQLNDKSKQLLIFSIAVSESTNIANTAQLAIFIRGFCNCFDVAELDLIPVTLIFFKFMFIIFFQK